MSESSAIPGDAGHTISVKREHSRKQWPGLFRRQRYRGRCTVCGPITEWFPDKNEAWVRAVQHMVMLDYDKVMKEQRRNGEL